MGSKSTIDLNSREIAIHKIMEFIPYAKNSTIEHVLELLNDDVEDNFQADYLGHHNFKIKEQSCV